MSDVIIISKKDQGKYRSDSGSWKRKYGYLDDGFVVSDDESNEDEDDASYDDSSSDEDYDEEEDDEQDIKSIDLEAGTVSSEKDEENGVNVSALKRYNLRNRISNIKESIKKAKDQGHNERLKQARKLLYNMVWNKSTKIIDDVPEGDEEYQDMPQLKREILSANNHFKNYLSNLMEEAGSSEFNLDEVNGSSEFNLDEVNGSDEASLGGNITDKLQRLELEQSQLEKWSKEKQEQIDKIKFERDFAKYVEGSIEKDMANSTSMQKEFKYFQKLSEEEKKMYLEMEQNVKASMTLEIPLKFKILKSNLPARVKGDILNRIRQFNELEPTNSEYPKLENWTMAVDRLPLDKYTDLPVSVKSPPEEVCQFLSQTAKTLDKCIYGQHDAKNKLMQIVAKWIRNDRARGNVIGLKGPPGVGKTTLINHGLSKALNKPMRMLSLGGANDQSILTGHMYTWEGATYGRIAGILMETQCMDPIIFFDELDKVSHNEKGNEIIGTLMHLVDFSQNHKFHDNYLQGIDLDLSRCIFIFSYNDENMIDPILRDRITVINMDGFQLKEKVSIAKNYLIPEILESIGLKAEEVVLSDDTIQYIINNYADDKGVRKLKECLETIYLKINLYSMANNNTEKLDMPYKIPDFQWPLQVTRELAKELLKERHKESSEGTHQTMIYL